ncbi:MAG TPA: hypothetical protein VJH92_01210 [Candidatus Nanoarchaeia archaeon]|nr:hypothetical protein [Candidatus Nanoarchaeia archaeon]
MERNEKTNGLIAVALVMAILMLGSIIAQNGSSTNNGSDDDSGREDNETNKGSDDIPDRTDSGPTNPPIAEMPYRLDIDPQRQMTEDGSAVYKFTFTDPHKGCVSTNEVACAAVIQSYTYELEFEGNDGGLNGEFSEVVCTGSEETGACSISSLNDEFEMYEQETKVIQLTVTAEKQGTHNFLVQLKGEGVKAYGKGALVYLQNGITPTPEDETAFFVGKGFVLSENKTDGFLLDLKILNKDSVLSGKAKIGDRNYKIDGEVAEVAVDGVDFGYTSSYVTFDIISIKTGEKVGSFEGHARQYTGFILLEGKIKNFEGKTWTLTAMGKKKFEVREFDLDDGESVEVSVGEAVFVPGVTSVSTDDSLDETEDEVYIKPIKVKEKRVLWIFPTSKKVVEIEVVKGDEVFKKKITEYSYENVEGYKVSVGSLEDDEKIEFDVEKA